MKIALIIAAILIAVGFFLWLGLRIQPRPFPNYPKRTLELQTVPLPAGLPAPVERYYHAR